MRPLDLVYNSARHFIPPRMLIRIVITIPTTDPIRIATGTVTPMIMPTPTTEASTPPTTEVSIGMAVIGNILNMDFANTDSVAANTGFGAGDSMVASTADIAGKL